jgi:hypothetical protein
LWDLGTRRGLVSGSTGLSKTCASSKTAVQRTCCNWSPISNISARSGLIVLHSSPDGWISSFRHPFITAPPRSCSHSSRHLSSTALIVRSGLQTLLAQIAEHEIAIIATLLSGNWKSNSELGIDQQRNTGPHRSRICFNDVERGRSNTSARLWLIELRPSPDGRISGFSHPFITAPPRSCSCSSRHSSSTALIVRPRLQTARANRRARDHRPSRRCCHETGRAL